MESGMCPGLEDGQREGEREGKGRDGDVHQPEQHYIYSILGFFFSLCSSKTWVSSSMEISCGNSVPSYSKNGRKCLCSTAAFEKTERTAKWWESSFWKLHYAVFYSLYLTLKCQTKRWCGLTTISYCRHMSHTSMMPPVVCSFLQISLEQRTTADLGWLWSWILKHLQDPGVICELWPPSWSETYLPLMVETLKIIFPHLLPFTFSYELRIWHSTNVSTTTDCHNS